MAERIGDGLVGIGAMKAEQRDEVLQMQNDGDKRMFGEIAIDLKYIDDEAILKFLESQGI
ncbi:MAG: hypothetical protein KAH95_17065 [Spirochaetales bacterium]|nr:hypothetical protein [Spirochaetales bacterium]